MLHSASDIGKILLKYLCFSFVFLYGFLFADNVDPGTTGGGIGTESSSTNPTWSGGEVYIWEVSHDSGTPGTISIFTGGLFGYAET